MYCHPNNYYRIDTGPGPRTPPGLYSFCPTLSCALAFLSNKIVKQ